MTSPRKIGPQTVPYAVLGHPVAHSLSPAMHNAAFEAMGLDAVYLAFDVTADRLMATLTSLRELGFGGVNLTLPLKETAREEMQLLHESARRAGAVNCVAFTPEGVRGYNTDGDGFLRALAELGMDSLRGRSVAVLGSGGAARGVAIACAHAGAAQIAIVARNAKRAERLTADLHATGSSVETRAVLEAAAQEQEVRAADLVVQCTPVGLRPGEPPLFEADAFREGQWVVDTIYVVPETPLMKAARQGGARVANGLGMLLHQGALSLEIWTGAEAPVEAMRTALEEAMTL